MTGRYGRDLTSAYTGPFLTSALQDVANMAKATEGGSDKTNNAEWQGVRGAYRASAASFLLAKLTEMSAGLAAGNIAGRVAIFAAMQSVAAPSTSRKVADVVAGERAVKPGKKSAPSGPEPEGLGDLDMDMNADLDVPPDL